MGKFQYIAILLIFYAMSAISQVSINRDNSNPDPSAGLDVNFSNKGFLPPRMTHIQMDSIATPAEGLMVYCTDCNPSGTGALAMFMNGSWFIFSPTCLVPSTPFPGTQIPTANQISWSWNPVAYATGYKWSINNSYDSAQDVGFNTNMVEEDLFCNTVYNRYVWAYNNCGHSANTQLTAFTLPLIPSTPLSGSNIPAQTQIIWKWQSVEGATGYKWNIENNYSTAIDLDNSTTYLQSELSCNSNYTCYVWSYNTCDHSIVQVMSQSTLPCSFPCGQMLTDYRNGKTYNTLSIGTQCWMKENLNIGARLGQYIGATNDGVIEKYCYGDLESNCDIYGGMYQWAEAVNYFNGASNTSSWNPTPTGQIKGVCPNGWHIPSSFEWDTLSLYLGGNSVAGGKLKENGTIHWAVPNSGATNSSGFTGLPGGSKPNIYYYNLTEYGSFWSTTENNNNNALFCTLDYQSPLFNTGSSITKAHGLSIRCLKDTCKQGPASPASGTHIPSPTQIIWYWNTTPGSLGYKWNTSDNYSTATDLGNASTYPESGLICNTSYTRYIWSYNDCGISIPLTITQTTSGCTLTCGQQIIDSRNGKSYNTVLIGDQCWMRENMNIGVKLNSQVAQTNNATIEKYCYAESESNCTTYGGLYQWAEAVQYFNGTSNSGTWNPPPTGNIQGICPNGWHVPSLLEWDTLANFLGGYTIAGGKMKESGTSHWSSPNTAATNSCLFTALPGGQKPNIYCYLMWQFGYFWAATESGSTQAVSLSLSFQNILLNTIPNDSKATGYSVRCLKN